MENRRLVGDEIPNHFAVKCIAFTFFGMLFISIFNLLGVFGTNVFITQMGFLTVSLFAVIACVVVGIFRLNKPWMKYFLLGIIEAMTLTICATLTYHATIIIVFPIVYACVFMDKRLIVYTYVLTTISIVSSVYLGYFFGVCDLNIVFLPTNEITSTVDSSMVVTGSDFILDGCWWKLLLYIIFPRIIVITAFFPVCNSLTKIITEYDRKAKSMEFIAKQDGMTGLYNKTWYLEMVKNYYKNLDKVGIINLDVNSLKYFNDNFGHENGDKLIIGVSEAIKEISTTRIMGYRVGGDEFVVVVEHPLDKELDSIVLDLKRNINHTIVNDFPISASIGYAVGVGSEYDNVYSISDSEMYKNKKLYHESMDY